MSKQKRFIKEMENFLKLEIHYNGDRYFISETEHLIGECLTGIVNFDHKALEMILREMESVEKSLRKGNDIRVIADIRKCVNRILDCLSAAEPYKSIINERHYNCLADLYGDSKLPKGRINGKDKEIIRALCGRLYTVCSELVYARIALADFLASCNNIGDNDAMEDQVAKAFAQLKTKLQSCKRLKRLESTNGRALKDPEGMDFRITVDYGISGAETKRFCENIQFTSLLVFAYWEAGKSVVAGIQLKQCKCCGKFYTTTKGYAYEYCNEVAPGESERTCRQIGAQKSHIEKVRNDPIWSEYRRVYKKYHARVRKNTMMKDEFQAWLERAQAARELAISGDLTASEFIAQLDEA